MVADSHPARDTFFFIFTFSLVYLTTQLGEATEMKEIMPIHLYFMYIDTTYHLSYKGYPYITPQQSFNICNHYRYCELKYLVQPPVFFQMIICSMHLLPPINVMLDFNFMDSVKLRRARGKRKNSKFKILANSGIRTTTLRFVVRTSTDWASRDWWKLFF